MAKILASFEIPEAVIHLESERDPGSMSEDDLNWCFGGSFKLLDAETKQSLLILPEASLLGLAVDLQRVVSELCEAGSASVRDKEGAFSLVFSLVNGRVHVADEFSDQAFEADVSELNHAVKQFVNGIVAALRKAFPQLEDNSNFVTLVEKLRFERIE